MAELLTREFAAEVETTATKKGGEFTVWVEGERVVKKMLFFKPSDEKILNAVRAALKP